MLLVKYGEIALKSTSVRKRFEQQLIRNIQERLMEKNLEAALEINRGVLTIRTNHTRELEEILAKTFGVIYYSRAVETSSDPEHIEEAAVKMCQHFKKGTTFAVRCKRSGNHPYTSMELAARIGSALYISHQENLRVDLTKPENTLWLEVRNTKCHIFTERTRGLGGMPIGTQGRAVLFIPKDREKDAAIAGWLVLKRGVSLKMLKERGAEDIVSLLQPWGGPTKCIEDTGQETIGLEEALRISRAQAVVLPDKAPREKPQLSPPTAILYPLASLPEKIYTEVRNLLFTVS